VIHRSISPGGWSGWGELVALAPVRDRVRPSAAGRSTGRGVAAAQLGIGGDGQLALGAGGGLQSARSAIVWAKTVSRCR